MQSRANVENMMRINARDVSDSRSRLASQSNLVADSELYNGGRHNQLHPHELRTNRETRVRGRFTH